MKPFNLEEYLANPSRKVVTRDGRALTRILCTDAKGDYPVIALIERTDANFGTVEEPITYTKGGDYCSGKEHIFDLFFAPEKHEGWVNIYKNERDYYFWKFIYPKKTDAEAVADSTCIATVKVEWEE